MLIVKVLQNKNLNYLLLVDILKKYIQVKILLQAVIYKKCFTYFILILILTLFYDKINISINML